MNAQDYWNLFLDTGAPEAYLMYSHLAKSEETHVLGRFRESFCGSRTTMTGMPFLRCFPDGTES